MKEDRRIDQAGSVGVLVGFYEREREEEEGGGGVEVVIVLEGRKGITRLSLSFHAGGQSLTTPFIPPFSTFPSPHLFCFNFDSQFISNFRFWSLSFINLYKINPGSPI